MKKALSCIPLAVGLCANAAPVEVDANIVRVLATGDGRFGGCMALLDTPLSNEGLYCRGNWVTFSCSGEHASKAAGSRMFESAYAAFVMELPVKIWIDETRKHNDFCFASRLDVLPAPKAAPSASGG